jgi:hypothetical protein
MTFPTTTPGTRVRNVAAAVVAAALIALGLGVDAASADRPSQSEVIVTKGGIVRFQHHGDILKAKDTRQDSYGVLARLALSKEQTLGLALDPSSRGKGRSKNLNVREGTIVYLQMCYQDHRGNNVRCSGVERAVA